VIAVVLAYGLAIAAWAVFMTLIISVAAIQ